MVGLLFELRVANATISPPVFPINVPKAHSALTCTPFVTKPAPYVATACIHICSKFHNLMLGCKGTVNIFVLETLPLIRKGSSSVSAKRGAPPSEDLATPPLPQP